MRARDDNTLVGTEMSTNDVCNALPMLYRLSENSKLNLKDFVENERSVPIPVFAERIKMLEKYGLTTKIGDKPAYWRITPLGMRVLKKFEEIDRLLVPRK